MFDYVEMLSRLSITGCDVNRVPGLSRNSWIEPTDVAAALSIGRLSLGARYLSYSLCEHEPETIKLIELLQKMVVLYTLCEGDAVSAEIGKRLALSAVLEVMTGRTCKRCNGVGFIARMNQSDLRTKTMRKESEVVGRRLTDVIWACWDCQGTGVIPMSDGKRAGLAGIPRRTYNRKYRNGRQFAFRSLQSWFFEISMRLYEQFEREKSKSGYILEKDVLSFMTEANYVELI